MAKKTGVLTRGVAMSEQENGKAKVAVSGRCTARTEVYARVCGFFRPVQSFNKGKVEEYRQRVNFSAGCSDE